MAFASIDQLSTRLGRTLTPAEADMASAFLDDATAYMRSALGTQFIESGTATVTLQIPTTQLPTTRVRLPQTPVRTISDVLLNGVADTATFLVGDDLYRPSGFRAGTNGFCTVTVTMDYGFTKVPADIMAWCCVLAAGQLAMVERSGMLSSSGVKVESLADYRVEYMESGTMHIPAGVLDRMRALYGSNASLSHSR